MHIARFQVKMLEITGDASRETKENADIQATAIFWTPEPFPLLRAKVPMQ